MFGPRKVTLVIGGSVGGYDQYEVLRDGEETDWNDMKSEYTKIIQTTEAEVVEHLEEHDVPHDREWDTVVLSLEDGDRLEKFLADDLFPRNQDRYIAERQGHPSARVEGYTVDPDEKTVEVEYTYIPGL